MVKNYWCVATKIHSKRMNIFCSKPIGFFLEQKISLEIGKMKHEKLPFVPMELFCGGVDFTQ